MKIIKYNLCTKINRGTEENPQIEEIYTPVGMIWNEANEELAKREAHNGEYTIVEENDTPEWIEHQIELLKRELSNTDYRILKVVEGASTLTEIAETISQRKGWRSKINELQAKLNNLSKE